MPRVPRSGWNAVDQKPEAVNSHGGINMALNMDAIGRSIGPLKRDYTWKDAVLYALGVGAGFSELDYCFEKDLKVIPSFSIAMIFDFLSQVAIDAGVNLAGILHGEQELIFHNPIPPEGTLTTNGKIIDYYDKGKDKGALIVFESQTATDAGRPLFTSIATLFSRLDGGFGGRDLKKPPMEFPNRDPDFVVDDTPSPDQPLLYRLSGDIFHLHADPEFAKLAGFDKPIMHGLCTHGFACRALIASLVPGQPERVRRLACRFSKALYPGVPIRTLIWKTGQGKALWRTVDVESGQVIIDNGEIEYGAVTDSGIRFDDKVAIVTGAGAGLGRVYALELARRGARVVVNDLGGARDGTGGGSASPADQVVAEIRSAGGRAVASHDSVATTEGGANIVKTALDAFGTVDILINNAGILRDKTFAKLEPENWQAVLDVHLTGAYNVTRHAFPVMKKKGYGRIIMTTSASGLYGNFGQTNYSAAKLGLVGLMNSLKLEGRQYHIHVNAVAPFAASRLTEDIMPPDLFQRSRPEFIAPLVTYLCSDRCSESGDIYVAGMGYYSRAAVVTGPGKILAAEGQVPTAEAVMANMEAIRDLSAGRYYEDLSSQVGDFLKNFQSPAAVEAESPPAGFSSVAQVFEAMPGAFVAEAAAGVDIVLQYIIAGAGEWHCIIEKGSCLVASGRHDRPTCTLKMKDGDFLKMINGQLLPMEAYTSGKLKIAGDVMKAQLIGQLFKF
jgi:NAD(P)-dependent dehydrogenase (short-subunit alcohol dehydrogenase family)/acyl dehydratase/putative sterol carrier protein